MFPAELFAKMYLGIGDWRDDPSVLKMAAMNAHLPFERLDAKECKLFPKLQDDQRTMERYIYLRNKMLSLWFLEPSYELTYEKAIEIIQPDENENELLKMLFEFLLRHGYINYGIFKLEPISSVPDILKLYTRPVALNKKIIVIGAGLSGLAAARQLKYFGFQVMVLEARERVGGRISTFIKTVFRADDFEPTKYTADLGATFIKGIIGNPLALLTRQINVDVTPVDFSNLVLYKLEDNKEVESESYKRTRKIFENVLQFCAYLARKDIIELNGENLSLGQAIESALKFFKYHLKLEVLNHWKSVEKLMNSMDNCRQEMILNKGILEECKKKQAEWIKSFSGSRTNEKRAKFEIMETCLKQHMKDAFERFSESNEINKSSFVDYIELLKEEPSVLLMNKEEEEIFNFFMASLESSLGAKLDDISLKYWYECELKELQGPYLTVDDGFCTLINALAEDLDILKFLIVDRIECTTNGVLIHYKENKCLRKGTLKADACICTVPLGVLKGNDEDKRMGNVKFSPPLPQWKSDAIKKLKIGTTNKMAMVFNESFWNDDSSFGVLRKNRRGEFYEFFSIPEKPILISILSGAVAAKYESRSHIATSNKLLEDLKSIFGRKCPSGAVDALLTRWSSDSFCRGSHTFATPHCTGDEFEKLAEPLCDENNVRRVFFAGEHTIKFFSGTAHGAFLSGLREAGRVADQFIDLSETSSI